MRSTVSLCLVTIIVAHASAVQQSTCDTEKAFLVEPTYPGTSIAKTINDLDTDRNTSILVAANENPGTGICVSLTANATSCCTLETETSVRARSTHNAHNEWEAMLASIENSSVIFSAGNTPGFWNTLASSSGGAPSGYQAFISSYLQYVANRDSGDDKGAAAAKLYQSIVIKLADPFAEVLADHYCSIAGNDLSDCVCRRPTWITAVKSYTPIALMAQQITRNVVRYFESSYQVYLGVKSMQDILRIIRTHEVSENCTSFVVAETFCQLCYGFHAYKPCRNLCHGRFRVCFGSIVKLIDPAWKKGIDNFKRTLTSMGKQLAYLIDALTHNVNIDCPTCTQMSSFIATANETCPSGGITLSKSGFCEGWVCKSNTRRHTDPTSTLLTDYIAAAKHIISPFTSTRRSVSGDTTEINVGEFEKVREVFTSMENEFCKSNKYADPTTNSCWKGTADLHTGNNSKSILQIKEKLLQLHLDLAAAADPGEIKDTQDQIRMLQIVDVVRQFSVSGKDTLYSPNTTIVGAALDGLAPAIERLMNTSIESTASESSSAVCHEVSQLFLLCLVLFAFWAAAD